MSQFDVMRSVRASEGLAVELEEAATPGMARITVLRISEGSVSDVAYASREVSLDDGHALIGQLAEDLLQRTLRFRRRMERADLQLSRHGWGGSAWRRTGPWRWGRNVLECEISRMEQPEARGTFTATFSNGRAVLESAWAVAEGHMLGAPDALDSDVTDDDRYDGNDQQIDDLKERVGDLRAMLAEATGEDVPASGS